MRSQISATPLLISLSVVAVGSLACTPQDTELGKVPTGATPGSGGSAGAPGSGGSAGTPGSGGSTATNGVLSTDGPMEAVRVSGNHVYYVKWLAPSGTHGHSVRRIPKTVKNGAPLPKPEILFDVPISKDWSTPQDFSIGFEVDATHLYFVDNLDETDATKMPALRRILRAPLSGGPVTSIVDETSNRIILDHIEVDGGFVYYVIDGDLKRVPADGSGSPTTLHDGSATGIRLQAPSPGASMFAISKGSVFICPFYDTTIFRLPAAGGALVATAGMYTGGGSCTDVVATGSNTYALTRDAVTPQTLESTLFEGPLSPPGSPGLEGNTIAASISHSGGLRFDGGFLYYVSEEGNVPTLVRRDPKTTTVQQLATETQAFARLGYDFDATHIYAIEGQYQLRKIPK